MSLFILVAALAASTSQAAGPDAAAIAELDWRESQRLCIQYHHVVPCRSWQHIVSNVRCTPVEGGVPRVFCNYVQRIPGLRRSEQNCSGHLEALGSFWSYPELPSPAGAGQAPSPMSRSVEAHLCSAVGAPAASMIEAVRARAYPRLACVLFSSADWSCPAASARVADVRCSWGARRLAWCEYRLHEEAANHFCRATFRSRRGGWALTGRRARDGRFTFDESCTERPRSG